MVEVSSSDAPRLSLRTAERFLAGVLLVLLATYVIGKLAEGAMPLIRDTGVLAVHVAALVAVTLPVVLIGHAVLGSVSITRSRPRWVEVGIAAVVLSVLVFEIVLQPTDAAEPLIWVLVGGLLVLTGLLLGRQ